MMVAVLVLAIFVVVVVVGMVVCTGHGGHGHLERFHVLFGFKLQHVGAFFKVID